MTKVNLDSLERVPDDKLVYAPMFSRWNELELDLPNDLIAYKPPPKGWVGASGLAGCVRKDGYKFSGAESAEMDEEGYHSTGIGTLIHLAIQAVCRHDDPERWKLEQKWELPDDKMCSHADIWDTKEAGEAIDIKSAPPFGFKMKLGEGPSIGHVLQATAAGVALGASKCRIVYICQSKLIGRDIPKDAEKGDRSTFWQEWTWDTEEAKPYLDQELKTVAKVRSTVENGKLPPRIIPTEMPKGARITDVGVPGDRKAKGAWSLKVMGDLADNTNVKILEAGQCWQCSYCDYQKVCADDLKAGK